MLPTISAIVFIKLDFVRNMVFRYGLNGPIRNGHVRAWSVDYLAETSDNYKVKHLPLPQVFLFREIHSRILPKLTIQAHFTFHNKLAPELCGTSYNFYYFWICELPNQLYPNITPDSAWLIFKWTHHKRINADYTNTFWINMMFYKKMK